MSEVDIFCSHIMIFSIDWYFAAFPKNDAYFGVIHELSNEGEEIEKR